MPVREPWFRNAFKSGFLQKEAWTRLFLMAIIAFLCYVPPLVRRSIDPAGGALLQRVMYRPEHEATPHIRSVTYLLCPTLLVAYVEYAIRHRRRRDQLLRIAVYFFLMVTMSLLCTIILCQILQRVFGVYRPDMLSRCYPGETREALVMRMLNGSDLVCTQTDQWVLRKGQLAFPSMHTAIASVLTTSNVLWLLHMVKALSGYTAEVLVLPLLILFPLFYGLWKTFDSPHDPHWFSDTFFGLLLGVLVAFTCFTWYYPGPWSKSARSQPGRLNSMEEPVTPLRSTGDDGSINNGPKSDDDRSMLSSSGPQEPSDLSPAELL